MSDYENRKNNIKGLWGNPRTRTVILILGGVALTMLLVSMCAGGDDPADASGTGTRTVSAPTVEARPGLVPDQEYAGAVRDENQERLDAARASGDTVLPTLEGGVAPPPLDPLANATAPPEGSLELIEPAPIQAPPSTQPVGAPLPPQPVPVVVSREEAAAQVMGGNRYKSVTDQIRGYMQAWVPVAGYQEFQYNGALPAPVAAPAPSQDQVLAASGAAPASGTGAGAAFVRAGTIVPAVLLTAINSDVPGPVVAQIVSGPLAGARVLGRFQATEQQVMVQFNTLSMPGQPKSFSIDAYAVNQNLGTGLATDVNNHYFRRYGLLLAAGFLEGYGSAIARSGTTTHVSDGGAIIVTQDELNSDEIKKVALGNVGTTIAGELAQRTDIPPTVKVEGKDGAGVPIGLLFMSDF